MGLQECNETQTRGREGDGNQCGTGWRKWEGKVEDRMWDWTSPGWILYCQTSILQQQQACEEGSCFLAVWIYSFALAPATCMLTAYGSHINTQLFSGCWSFYFFSSREISQIFIMCLVCACACVSCLDTSVTFCPLRFRGNLHRRATKKRRLKCHVADWFIDWAVTFYLTA